MLATGDCRIHAAPRSRSRARQEELALAGLAAPWRRPSKRSPTSRTEASERSWSVDMQMPPDGAQQVFAIDVVTHRAGCDPGFEQF